jgi:hypothetical protein
MNGTMYKTTQLPVVLSDEITVAMCEILVIKIVCFLLCREIITLCPVIHEIHK